MENKNYAYIGLVGRKQTAAITSMTKDNLEFKNQRTLFKFPESRYYEFMYTLATAIVDKAIEKELNCVIYTIDCIIDSTRAFFKAYKKNKPFDFESFAENQVCYKRELPGADEELIDNERDALAEYLKSVAKLYNFDNLSVKFEKAKEVDQLTLNIPEEVKVADGDLISFENGKTKEGITVYGWTDFNRKYARVKTRYEKGEQEPIYFIYRNDRTALGQSKSDMLRFLWGQCPNYEKEIYTDFVKVA